MTEEPKWPTADAVVEHAHGGPGTAPCYDSAVHAIDMCRVAWLASVDDPSKSPVGEVRQSPKGFSVVRTADPVADCWIRPAMSPKSGERWFNHLEVKGWPVIGAVPGTPAAEAKP